MGKRSYSRQSMQKFIDASTVSVPAGETAVGLDITVPEEIVVKRITAHALPFLSAEQNNDNPFCLAVTQSDTGSAQTTDIDEPNRLVRSEFGNTNSPGNLDYTLTMRKLDGSGIHLLIQNLELASQVTYHVRLVVHYLEI